MTLASLRHQGLSGLMARKNLGVGVLCAILLLAVWSIRIPQQGPPISAFTPFDGGSTSGSTKPDSPHTFTPPKRPNSNDVDLSDPAAPFVGWPLKRVCDEAKWVEGLVYICDNNSGGIGNIRNYVQTCLRYALEAGATGLVIPKIRKRSDKDLADLFTDYLPFSYMFDENHFRDAFNQNCPQITLYADELDIPGIRIKDDGTPNIELITPKDWGDRGGCDWKDQNRHTDRFGDRFRFWLQNETAVERGAPSIEHPRLIRFNWGVLWDWPIYRDGPEFASTFGAILKPNKDLMGLGKKALANMHKFSKSVGGKNGRFLGAHLRTESDAMGFWPVYDVQSKAYIKQAKERGFKAAYLATGNATEAKKFEELAASEVQMRIVTKTDLLDGIELEHLNALSWDQQAVVDWIVLLGSEYFVGVMPSSFSVLTTIKRHLKTDGLYTRPYKTGTEGDGLSYMVGNYDLYWEQWLFMFDGMWP